MISHLDGLTSRLAFINSVIYLRTSAKKQTRNVASSRYYILISDDSDNATSSTVIAKRKGPIGSPCRMPVDEQIRQPDARTVEMDL